MKNLHNEVDRLIIEFALTDCEAGDLSAFADILCCYCDLDVLMVHLEMRAEILSLCGSEMEEMYTSMEKWGKEQQEKQT